MDYRPTTIESNERRWRDWLVVLALPLTFLSWPLQFVRRWYWLKARGFWAAGAGRDAVEYQELRSGRVERLTIDGEMMIGARHVVYVPNEKEWRQTMPAWAQGRRMEIVDNVKRRLGTKHYEYDYSIDEIP